MTIVETLHDLEFSFGTVPAGTLGALLEQYDDQTMVVQLCQNGINPPLVRLRWHECVQVLTAS
jgi:hypothetical protein